MTIDGVTGLIDIAAGSDGSVWDASNFELLRSNPQRVHPLQRVLEMRSALWPELTSA